MLVVAIICGVLIDQFNSDTKAVVQDQNEKNVLIDEIKKIFKLRNQALLKQDEKMLANFYNREVKTGRWAYQYELKKMNYLKQWAAKQGVRLQQIESNLKIRNKREEENSLIVSLLVATEYQYSYSDSPVSNDKFRIGTYHSLKLEPQDDNLVIIREWYQDPLADSMQLDKKEQEEAEKIIEEEFNDLENLNKKRTQVVDYADKYCGAASLAKYGFQYNSDYKNYNYLGGDCANFASQMLYEAGGISKNSVWNYNGGSATRAWVNASAFNQHFVYSNRASKIAYGSYSEVLKDSYKLLPGDYIAYEKKGEIEHISVVTGIDSEGYRLVNCHNSDRYRVPWDIGWSSKGVKFWLVRVHYN